VAAPREPLTPVDRRLYIDGAWVESMQGTRADVANPATGGSAGTSAIAGPDDLARAVEASRAGGRAWRAATPDERAAVLRRCGDLLDERVDALARILTAEQGKTLGDSAKEIRFAGEVFRYYAEEGRRVHGSLRVSQRRDVKSIVSHAPLGLVATIVPWNYPVDLYAWKVAPALAAGCTVIAKPPADAPLAIAELVQALHDAGLPAGALADLPGGAALGDAIVAHPAIMGIAATVSTQTGRRISAGAAPTLKRVALELGGQTPFIVLDDADIDEAAAAAVRRSFSNMGQICIAVNRVLVAESRRRELVEAIVERTRALRIGDPASADVEYGPVFDRAVLERTRSHVEDAVARGGQLAIGGSRLRGGALDAGLFVAPAVLDQAPYDSLVMNEESFGPVLPIAGAGSDQELLEHVNALPYGLAAYVFSADLERAWAFADRIEAGAIGINVNDVTELQAPFGGWKLSGGGRDLGPEGLHTFLQTRHVRARVRPLADP
jgi:succinate-semialdehyde dehydrogenase / glutarate-semialdehyde dehydrogenase